MFRQDEVEQLDDHTVRVKPPKKRRPNPGWTTCKCGHAKHRGPCALCRGQCKRFRPRSRPPVEQPPHLQPPAGSLVLERDDTKKDKRMGWAVVEPARVILYLEQLRTRSLNKSFFGGKEPPTAKQWKQMSAWQGKYRDDCRERALSAIAQCGPDVAARGRPSKITFTRISTGTPDEVNLAGSLKFVEDGLAAAFDYDDKLHAYQPNDGMTHVVFGSMPPGRRGVRGVKIVLEWA